MCFKDIYEPISQILKVLTECNECDIYEFCVLCEFSMLNCPILPGECNFLLELDPHFSSLSNHVFRDGLIFGSSLDLFMRNFHSAPALES